MNLTLEYESFQDFASRLWPYLSEEGMWVPSEHPAAVGELVDFDVMLADGFRLFHGTGQVIAVGPAPGGGTGSGGMTLRFSQLDQPSRNLVRKVVSKHIGEGGKLFVLATPATKVEVVGDDEAPGTAETGAASGMGPADLVAPFAGLEAEAAWNGEPEPELSSFLRPSGRTLDLDDGGDGAREDPSSASPEVVEESLFATEDGTADPDSGSASASEWDATQEVGSAASDSVPRVEAWSSLAAGDSGPDEAFEQSLAETQRVEPAALAEDRQVEISLEPRVPKPMPSTFVPPALPDFGAEGDLGDDEPATDDFYPHGTGASAGRTWWPWVVVGGLALGAGLYALLQLDTPLSGGAEREQVEDVKSAGSAPPPMAAQTARLDSAAAIEVTAEEPAGAAIDAAHGEETVEEPASAPGRARSGRRDAAARAAAEESVEDGSVSAADVEPQRRAEVPEMAESVAPVAVPVVGETPDLAGPALLSLQRITWRDVDGDTVIRLALRGPLADDRFETQRVAGGSPRVVLKVLGTSGGVPRGPVAIGSDEVQQLRFGIHEVDGVRQVHAVADLVEESVELVGTVAIEDGAVELRFGRP